MSTAKFQIERDCTEKCKCVQHGDNLSSVITKRGVTDAELCSFINWKCASCGHVCDSMGRNAMHFASSCGRTKLLKWFVNKRNAQIDSKDLESGYTALHRSIFYGQINAAVTLIRLGSNMHVLDHNDLTPLDHAMKDRLDYSEFSLSSNCQIYVWGTNINYTLGTGNQHAKQIPDLLDAFHKKYTDASVMQVCMSKFHTVIVSKNGRVFSCGHGHGGRLGLNTENTILIPEQIHFHSNTAATGLQPFVCVQASIGRDHSMFLSETGHIWTCGLNTHHVLGIKPAPVQLVQPRLVVSLSEFRSEIKGICAARFHSIAWSSNALYTWGLHAGQLGYDKSSDATIITPKLVSNIFGKDTEIVHVATSDGATVLVTKKGDVFVLHEYKCRKIASKQLNVEKVIVVGGHLNSKLSNHVLVEKGGNKLKVLVLHKTGNLFLWQESWPQLSRCIYTLNRPLVVKDAVLSHNHLFFVTVDGEAFKGEFKKRIKKIVKNVSNESKTQFHEFLEKNECQLIKVDKFPHIHRAVKIQCDLKGINFAVIQCVPEFLLIDVPVVSTKTIKQDLLNLLNNSDEMDTIHDAIFKVSTHIFPVHHYIIALESEQLDTLINSNYMNVTIELTNINPIIFKQILVYIYTGTCDLLICGECLPEIININHNPIGLLQQAAKRFGIKSLYKKLDNYIYGNGYIQLKHKQKSTSKIEINKFDRCTFHNLHDVSIQSNNGKELRAHKCILAARLDYFNNLFALRWNEQSTKTKKESNLNTISLPISYNCLKSVIDFLYTDDANDLKNTDDIDHISNVLIVSDQLFIDRLKEICEVVLSNLLTLKNAAYILQFASIYNSAQLKRSSMEFISLNLSAVLELKILHILDEDLLNDLTDFYCNWNKILCKRVITPYSDAPSDEIVKSIHESFPVNIEDADDSLEDVEKKTQKLNIRKKTRYRKTNTKSVSETNTIDTLNISSTNQVFEEITENQYTDEKWEKILLQKQKHQKLIQNRLQVIESAKEKLKSERVIYNFTKISPQVGPSTTIYDITKNLPQMGPSTTIYDIPIKKCQKLSQKQRKKLSVDFDNMNTELKSVADIIKDNKLKENTISIPKSPWKKIETPLPQSQIVNPEIKENFHDIIADELKQKGNLTKMRTRSLIFSQIEDKAISDLERFYNIDQVSDECITIHKVDKGLFAATPLWVHKNN